jgi:hypothetical protein
MPLSRLRPKLEPLQRRRPMIPGRLVHLSHRKVQARHIPRRQPARQKLTHEEEEEERTEDGAYAEAWCVGRFVGFEPVAEGLFGRGGDEG